MWPSSFGAAFMGCCNFKDWLKAVLKELWVYGTPAEEGGSGKVYMVRAGLFNDVDLVLHWHPMIKLSQYCY